MSQRLVRTVGLTLSGVLLAMPALAFEDLRMRRQGQVGAAPAGAVPLPYIMRDNFGMTWDVQHDGTIGDGGGDHYDGGSRLAVNDNPFEGQQTATFDPAANQVTFAPQSIGVLRVSRRVAVNAAAGWCRFTETFENPTAGKAGVQVRVHFDLGGGIQDARAVDDPKKKGPLGVAIFDGRHAIAMLGGGRGGKVQCRYTPQRDSDQCELAYDIEVPPKQTVSVVHFQAVRQNSQSAVDFMLQTSEKDLLAGLPKEIVRTIVNFRASDPLMAEFELPRVPLQDIVELRSGDQYRGSLSDAVFKLQTFQGVIELPADRVIGMMSVGAHQPMQLFLTVDGEIVGGTLSEDVLKMQLASGQKVAVPLTEIARVGCRKRPGEPEEFKFDKPMVFLRDGQRLRIEAPADPITVATICGAVKLPATAIGLIRMRGDEQALHQVTLKDGSKFAAVMAGDHQPLRFEGAAADSASAEPTSVPLAHIDRIALIPGEIEPIANAPSFTLGNGDVFVGSIVGAVEVKTRFDVLKANGAEIQAIRPVEAAEGSRALPGEVTITLWGGATISGRLVVDTLDVKLLAGVAIRVPVTAIAEYHNPEPAAPSPMVEQIRGMVAQLNDPDWKKRERAAGELRSLGAAAAVVLKQMRAGQPPETQKQIDTLLKAIETEQANQQNPASGVSELNKDGFLPPLNKEDLLPR